MDGAVDTGLDGLISLLMQVDGSLKCEFLEKWVCIQERGSKRMGFDKP